MEKLNPLLFSNQMKSIIKDLFFQDFVTKNYL